MLVPAVTETFQKDQLAIAGLRFECFLQHFAAHDSFLRKTKINLFGNRLVLLCYLLSNFRTQLLVVLLGWLGLAVGGEGQCSSCYIGHWAGYWRPIHKRQPADVN